MFDPKFQITAEFLMQHHMVPDRLHTPLMDLAWNSLGSVQDRLAHLRNLICTLAPVVEDIRTDAWEQGRDQGYTDGYQVGHEQGQLDSH